MLTNAQKLRGNHQKVFQSFPQRSLFFKKLQKISKNEKKWKTCGKLSEAKTNLFFAVRTRKSLAGKGNSPSLGTTAATTVGRHSVDVRWYPI